MAETEQPKESISLTDEVFPDWHTEPCGSGDGTWWVREGFGEGSHRGLIHPESGFCSCSDEAHMTDLDDGGRSPSELLRHMAERFTSPRE